MLVQDEIIRMAQEAGFDVDEGLFPFEATEDKYIGTPRNLERFADLVAAHSREKRTQELMQLFLDPENQPTQFGTATLEYREQEVLAEREACAQFLESDLMSFASSAECAAAIRARGDK